MSGHAPHIPSPEEQVERERREIENAPPVQLGAALLRCHFCGALVAEVNYVETIGGVERFKGVSCCGG